MTGFLRDDKVPEDEWETSITYYGVICFWRIPAFRRGYISVFVDAFACCYVICPPPGSIPHPNEEKIDGLRHA